LVDGAGKLVEYEERYDLELVDYDLDSEDKFAEPSSQIVIRGLTVRNVGGMPTPQSQPVVIRIPASRWIEPHAHTLQLTRSLQPGESYTFEQDCLKARIAELADVPVGRPLHDTDEVSPRAVQAGVNRRYARFDRPKTLRIAFPAEVTSVHSLASQTPGEAAVFRVTVANTSRHDLGRDSDGRRCLRVRIGLLNQDRAEDLMLLDLQGRQCNWDDGLEEDIPLLRSGDSADVEAIVGVLPGTPEYAKATLTAVLRIGGIERPHEPRDRHRRDFELRIAQAYKYDRSADILLIANHGTTRVERRAWEQIAARLEKRVNIWDVSWEDSLSLGDRLRHGGDLLGDFRDKTIVLSDAVFQTVLGPRRGDQYLSQLDLTRAFEGHGIRLLVLNEQGHDALQLLRERLVPVDSEIEHRYSSKRDFFQNTALGKFDRLRGCQAAQASGWDPLEYTSAISIYGILPANRRRLRRHAVKLQQKLESVAPGTRYVVTYRMPRKEDVTRGADRSRGGSWFLFKRLQGTLIVRPTVGDARPNIIALPATGEDVHAADFITGPKVLVGLVQAIGFREKVEMFDDRLRQMIRRGKQDGPAFRETQMLGGALLDAILADVATESASILRSGWKPLFFGATIAHGLGHLRFLADYAFPSIAFEGERAEARLAARLVAGVEFLARTRRRWYEHWLFPWSPWRRGPALRRQMLRLSAALRENLFGDGPRKATRDLIRREYGQFRRLKRFLSKRMGARAAADGVLLESLRKHGIRTDVQEPLPRVFSHDEWQILLRDEGRREADQVALQREKQQRRAEFLVARNGRPAPTQADHLKQAVSTFTMACSTRRR
jgi:hypothetical protein